MGRGADLSKKKPPVEFPGSSALSEIEYTPEVSSNEQSNVCSQCRQNRRASASIYKRETKDFENIIFDVLGSLDPKNPQACKDIKTDLGIYGTVCCSKDESGKYACVTFSKLVEGYEAGVESRGCYINPCKSCERYWNKEHPQGHCIGKFDDYDASQNSELKVTKLSKKEMKKLVSAE